MAEKTIEEKYNDENPGQTEINQSNEIKCNQQQINVQSSQAIQSQQQQQQQSTLYQQSQQNSNEIRKDSVYELNEKNAFQEIQNSYQIGQIICESQLGTVSLITHKQSGIVRALKIVKKMKETDFKQQIQKIKSIDHPYIVQVFEIYQDSKFLYIISEYCTGEELLDSIKNKSPFTEKLASKYIKQIISALSCCHINEIIHRYVKPENLIFYSKEANSQLKLLDIGFEHIHYNPYYTPPEIFQKSKYDQSCDMWSLGVIMYLLLYGKVPFNGNNDEEVYNQIKNGKYHFDGNISNEAKDLLERLLKVDPKQRITSVEAYAHPWIVNNLSVDPLDDFMMDKLNLFVAKNKAITCLQGLFDNIIINNQDKLKIFQQNGNSDTHCLNKEGFSKVCLKFIDNPIKCREIVEDIFQAFDNQEKIQIDVFIRKSEEIEKKKQKDKIVNALKKCNNSDNINTQTLKEILLQLPSNKNILQLINTNEENTCINTFVNQIIEKKQQNQL